MNNIKNELEELERDFNDLNKLIKENVVIDDNMIAEDDVYNVINTNREIINELNGFNNY